MSCVAARKLSMKKMLVKNIISDLEDPDSTRDLELDAKQSKNIESSS
jgi:hypothetical protein